MESTAESSIEDVQEQGEHSRTSEENGKYERILNQIRTLFALNHLKNDREPALICEGLFLGSIGAAMSKDTLREYGITHVLTVADKIKPPHPDFFTYKVISILDDPRCSIRAVFQECIEYIDDCLSAGFKVLVHCFAGKSRSASVIIAYLMTKRRISLQDAFRYVRERRGVVMPNTGFMMQLKQYELELGL